MHRSARFRSYRRPQSPTFQLNRIRNLSSTPSITKKPLARSLTHAHLIETAQILAPGWKHLSPCLGAAIESSPLCGNFLRIGAVLSLQSTPAMPLTTLSDTAKLATQLFFQPDRHQPLRMIRSQSMAAAYLTPRIIGTLVGLSNPMLGEEQRSNLRRSTPTSAVNDILRREGIRSNYVDEQWTGVSLQRWKNLIVDSSSAQGNDLIIPIWLKAVWEKSTDKSCLLDFLLAVERTTQNTILNLDELGDALRHDPSARHEWATKTFDPQSLSPEAGTQALEALFKISPTKNPKEWSHALEVMCASMAVQHAYKPAIAPGKYGYDGGAPKSDCVEVTIRELFDLILWDESTGSFDLSRLPSTASQDLIDLYVQQHGGERWFQVLSDLPGCDYLMKSPNGKSYELTPTLANIAEVTRLLLGVGGERASTLNHVSEMMWKVQKLKLHVSSRVSRHRAALGEETVVNEIATAFLDGGKNGIEMRLDKAHAICTVTHLRLQNSALAGGFTQTLLSLLEDTGHPLKTIALAVIGDQGLAQDSDENSVDELLWKLLATSYGPDRRGLLQVVVTPDLARREREVRHKLEESQDVIRRALSKICRFSGDPTLQKQLLTWMLNETPAIIDDEAICCQAKLHDSAIERMVLNLPNELLGDDAVHHALNTSSVVRGKILTRIAKMKIGTLPVSLEAVRGMTVGEMLSLITLCARFSLSRL